ncbi:MAG: recombinase family protein [Promethearchaeota archaeon]
MRAALYVRVSTLKQVEGTSIENQLQKLREYTKANNIEISKEYVDRAISGSSISRPAFQELIKDAREKKFDIVLIYKLDRFSRNLLDLLETVKILEENKIKIKSLTEPFDTSNFMGEAFMQMIGVFANLERNMIKARVKEGKEKKFENGGFIFQAPYGYYYKDRKLNINDRESEIVKSIYDDFLNGLGLRKLSKKYEKPISTIKKILTNPVYVGNIKWKLRLEKGTHMPIVSEDIFKKVQDKFEEKIYVTIKKGKEL